MRYTFTILLIFFVCCCYAQSTTTYRDNLGRKTGTATTDSRGVTTYRDELGRKTGTSETNSRGEPFIVMPLAERLALQQLTAEV